MAKWYHAGAKVHGVPMQYEEACERVYGEPYGDWKKKNQKKASHSVDFFFDACFFLTKNQLTRIFLKKLRRNTSITFLYFQSILLL